MKPTPQQIVTAVNRLRRDLKFFPTDDSGIEGVMDLFDRMVPTQQALDWLVLALVDHVGKWPSPADVRGMLCTAYKPLDGIEGNTQMSGFSAGDNESGNAAKIGRDRQLPAAKPVPEPPLSDEEKRWIQEFNQKLKSKRV